jgi:tRNA-Thr(GGU) m(6)t(6)A37 methyltransferase TsaA
MTLTVTPIGIARTPYVDWAPHQPPDRDAPEGRFKVVIDDRYTDGLADLDRFSHIIIIAFLDRSDEVVETRVRPPWAGGREVGLWASRSPSRPSPLGLTIVRLVRIEGNTVFTSPMDLLDGTPVVDIKPYIRSLDSHAGANDGWIEDLDGHEHLLQHLRGVSHDHDQGHDPHHHGHHAVDKETT